MRLVGYRLVPLAAVILGLLTGNLGDQNQGWPFPWKNVVVCPGPGNMFGCYFQPESTWTAFALDVLVFAGVGYGLLLTYTALRIRRSKQSILNTISEGFHDRVSMVIGGFRRRSTRTKRTIGLSIGVSLVLFLFLAPVVPGETSATYYPTAQAQAVNCWPCDSCFVMHEYWSDWRSPSYALVGVGYHTPKIFEFQKSDVCL